MSARMEEELVKLRSLVEDLRLEVERRQAEGTLVRPPLAVVGRPGEDSKRVGSLSEVVDRLAEKYLDQPRPRPTLTLIQGGPDA